MKVDSNNLQDEEEEWGNPPSPNTLENRKKALRAQLIIGIIALFGIFLPGLLFWLVKG